ncbi:hypothetical protein [Streptomyces rimosus]|uniref:hypothetical protein n=1 Tax=Streptomyces rimosus TaxID=1927 RepID=UPI0037D31B73
MLGGRTEYQVALQTGLNRRTVHRTYWWPRPGLRPAPGNTSEPTVREPIPKTFPGKTNEVRRARADGGRTAVAVGLLA